MRLWLGGRLSWMGREGHDCDLGVRGWRKTGVFGMIMYGTTYAIIRFITSGIYQYLNNAMIQNLQINIHTTQ